MVIPDEDAEKEGYFRVVDESGEDYLYPASYFILVELPAEAQAALRMASRLHHPSSIISADDPRA